jgi:MerR family mercuric resistance operon transcriptional regulator
MTAEITIGRLAQAAGVGVETVRYYQRRGLMPVTASGARSFRSYGPEHIDRLQFIKRAQTAGFSLEEIGELLELDGSRERKRVRELARERLKALDEKIAELRASQASLSRLLQACEAKSGGCCPIIDAFAPPRKARRATSNAPG